MLCLPSVRVIPGFSLGAGHWGCTGRSDLPSRITAIILWSDKQEDEFGQAHVDASQTSSHYSGSKREREKERETFCIFDNCPHSVSTPYTSMLSPTHSNMTFIFHHPLESTSCQGHQRPRPLILKVWSMDQLLQHRLEAEMQNPTQRQNIILIRYTR